MAFELVAGKTSRQNKKETNFIQWKTYACYRRCTGTNGNLLSFFCET